MKKNIYIFRLLAAFLLAVMLLCAFSCVPERPDEQTEPSDGSTIAPVETTTPPPETTTLPPETTTVPPETTTLPPETTTEPPETTTLPPETTTEPPVTTTLPPETTTVPPETTAPPPETTLPPSPPPAAPTHEIYNFDKSKVPAGEVAIIPTDVSRVSEGKYLISNQTSYTPDIAALTAADTVPELTAATPTAGPLVLIISTYPTEGFSPEGSISYKEMPSASQDNSQNVIEVGKVLCEELIKSGIASIQCTDAHHLTAYSAAWNASAECIQAHLAKYPSIKYVIDIRRDSLTGTDGSLTRPVTVVDDKPAAQVMCVVGTDSDAKNDKWQNNLSLALKLRERLNGKYSNLCRPVYLRTNAYNQQYAERSVMLYIGANGNYLSEVKESARIVARELALLMLENATVTPDYDIYHFNKKDVPAGQTAIVPTDLSYLANGENYIFNRTDGKYQPDVAAARESYTLPKVYDPSSTGPLVLVVHTHGSEGYAPEGSISYKEMPNRAYNIEKNVVAVGKAFCEELERQGIGAVHCTDMHDVPDYNNSYASSKRAIEKYLKEYPTIKFVVDIHRDALSLADGSLARPVTVANGKAAAQVMCVVGTDSDGKNDNWQNNFSFALKLRERLNDKYYNICRPVSLKKKTYNQQYGVRSILLEVGMNGNYLSEAKVSARIVAAELAEMIKQ